MEKKSNIIIFRSDLCYSFRDCMEKSEFILDYYPPAGFSKRGRDDTGTCASRTLKAVIEAKTGENRSLDDYADGWWSSTTKFMTPWSLVSVIKKYGLQCKILNCRFKRKSEKLKILKQEVLKGPVILSIANGLTKESFFSRKKALTHWHYISLWGYNDEEECFYVYDSSCVRELDENLKIGTIKIPYKYVLKCRNFGYYKIIANFGVAVRY